MFYQFFNFDFSNSTSCHQTFHLNTDQITDEFVEKIKELFPHKEVEIIVNEKEIEQPRKNWAKAFTSYAQTEDEKLFSSMVNESDDSDWTW